MTELSEQPEATAVAEVRRQIYSLCEHMEDEALARLEGEKDTHAKGFYRGQKSAAKTISRAMGEVFRDLPNLFPPPSYDGSKSLGERLYEAVLAADRDAKAIPWRELDPGVQARMERAALNFTARLSDRGEGLGGPHEPAVLDASNAPSADVSDTGKASG